jgi:acetyl esterase/lipase
MRSRRTALLVMATAAIVLLAACMPTLGPAPSLPAAGSCNPGPTCCPTTATGVTFEGNLVYGTDNDTSTKLYADAYLPTTGGPHPAVVMVHGGSHVGGDKCDMSVEGIYLAQHGLVALSINYPLATTTQSTFTEAPADADLAVKWTRTYASALGVDPNEIALWGASAGSDIAFDAGLEAQVAPVGTVSGRVQAMVGWSGAYDWVTDYYRDGSFDAAQLASSEKYLGCSDVSDPDCWADLVQTSPMTHVTVQDPPSLLATSTDAGTLGQCEVVNPQNTIAMQETLQAHGDAVKVVTTSACGHALGYAKKTADAPDSGTMLAVTTTWLQQQLSSSASPHTTPTPLPPRITGPSIVTTTSSCPPDPGSGVDYTANVVYGQDFGNPTYLDVFSPTGLTTAAPAVVAVHGGGHVGGDKCDSQKTAVALAQAGFVVFLVNYPLASDTQPTFPNPVYDVMDAVAFARANAATYHVDPDHIGLWGSSAGGNLASMAALAAPLVEPAGRVQAVVSWSGTQDVNDLLGEYTLAGKAGIGSSSWAQYLGCANGWSETWDTSANACLVLMEQSSPVQLVDPLGGSFGAPPAILVASSTDFIGDGTCEIVPPRGAAEVDWRAVVDRMTVQYDTNDQCAHAQAYFSTEFPATLAFFQAQLP